MNRTNPWNQHSVSESESASASQSVQIVYQGLSESRGFQEVTVRINWAQTRGVNYSKSSGYNISAFGVYSAGPSESAGESSGTSQGGSTSHSVSESSGRSVSNSTSISESFGNSVSKSLSKSQGVSDSISINESMGTNESWSDSQGASRGESWGANTSDSVSHSRSSSASDGWSKGVSSSEGISVSQSQSRSYGTTRGYSKGQSVSDAVSNSWGRSQGVTNGFSGSLSQATSASMGVGPSLSYSKSFRWLDQEVKNILTLLEFQNERLMRALNGNGAFFTDVYIATPDEETKAAAQSLAKSAWYDDNALICPLQVLDLDPEEQSHLLYHFNAFSADTTVEGVMGDMQSYKYTTILLPDEYAAYTHLPRISEGGIFADVPDIPKFAVPSMKEGEIYMGKILSGERWSQKWGYETPYDYRISSDEIMHGFFTGESRSGKTVAATRFIAELANKVRRKNGKKMRIVCMDFKQDWRVLAKFVEPERFHFYSLGNPEFLPINLNICKIPKNVYPQQWVDGIIEIYCRAYGLGERGKSVLSETLFEL